MNLYCLNYRRTMAWTRVTRSYLRADRGFGHYHRERFSNGVFVRWHSVKMYAVRRAGRPYYYVSTALCSWQDLSSNRLLLVPFPSIFFYYGNPALDR